MYQFHKFNREKTNVVLTIPRLKPSAINFRGLTYTGQNATCAQTQIQQVLEAGLFVSFKVNKRRQLTFKSEEIFLFT